jgi:hypothetical protein
LYDYDEESFTLLNEGPSPISNQTWFNMTVGEFQLIGNFSGNENYTFASESWILEIDPNHSIIEFQAPQPTNGRSPGGGSFFPPATTPECEPVWEVNVGECINGMVTITYEDSCGEDIVQVIPCDDFICDENFDCGAWSGCVDGKRQRQCAYVNLCSYKTEQLCEYPLRGRIGDVVSDFFSGIRKGKGIIVFVVFLSLGILVFAVKFALDPSTRLSWLVYRGEKAIDSGNMGLAMKNYVLAKKIYDRLPEKEKGKAKKKCMKYFSKVNSFVGHRK